jgi:hypothetical protein
MAEDRDFIESSGVTLPVYSQLTISIHAQKDPRDRTYAGKSTHGLDPSDSHLAITCWPHIKTSYATNGSSELRRVRFNLANLGQEGAGRSPYSALETLLSGRDGVFSAASSPISWILPLRSLGYMERKRSRVQRV